MFENYQYISDNSLDLCSFIEDYKKGEKSEWKEKDGKIIMETNRESKQKILYIDAKSGKTLILTSFLIEYSKIFNISSDYLLGKINEKIKIKEPIMN